LWPPCWRDTRPPRQIRPAPGRVEHTGLGLMLLKVAGCALAVWIGLAAGVRAQSVGGTGSVRDEAGGALPGVLVELLKDKAVTATTVTDSHGNYRLEVGCLARCQLSFTLVNFGTVRREITAPASGEVRADVVLRLALNAEVAVTGKG